MPNGICRLCNQTRSLQDSHIIPKFVFDWMKRSGSTYLRVSGKPNLRQQDGLKYPLLCTDCEQRFSEQEKWFAENVFTRYLEHQAKTFDYDASLHYFLVSVLWRVLQDDWQEIAQGHPFGSQLELAEYEWRTYLLGGRVPPTYNDVHLFLTDIGVQDESQPVVNFNRYFTRLVDHTVAKSETRCVVYAKFARFIVFGGITGLNEEDFIGTKVYPLRSTLTVPQKMLDGILGEFMLDRARTTHEMSAQGISERQRGIINDAFKKDAARILASDLGAVLKADFGNKVDPSTVWPKVGDEENCPCGSGKKYKDCHSS
jgi:SEC-C motif